MLKVELDLRALAALRIGLGLTVLLDLLLRSQDLTAFYTDDGVLPRSTLLQIPHPTYLNLYLAVGDALGAGFLMLLLAAAALGFTLGWQARWCALATWMLHIALKHRNPLILDVGDLELGLALFWCIFLPVGARYSLQPQRDLPDRCSSVATLGYLLQISLIYLMAYVNKSDPVWRENGLALYYCLSYDKFASGLGQSLLQYPALLQNLSLAIPFLELAIAVLLWIPRTRLVACLLIAALQLGIGTCMSLGLIPLISIVVSLGLWPVPRPRLEGRPTRLPGPIRILLGLNCVYLVYLNWALVHPTVYVPMPIKVFGYLLRQQQDWVMFAPHPGEDDGWYVARATLRDGSTVDLLQGGRPASLRKPERFPAHRWQVWLHNLSSRRDPLVNESFARYLIRGNEVRRLELIYVAEPTPPPGQPLVSTPITLYEVSPPSAPPPASN